MEAARDRRAVRRAAEQRRRAQRRRRYALAGIAALSLAAGVAVGAGRDSGGEGSGGPSSNADNGSAKGGGSAVKLERGGLGPPPGDDLTRSQAPVPVLMYHVIANAPSGASLPELYVDPKTFDAQMEWLRSQGYQAVSLNQVYESWFKGGLLPRKPMVLSFDDGYRGQYVFARRELRKLGWPGVLNLLVRTYTEPNGELTPQMVQRMIEDGWELDSHTSNHLDVSRLSGAQLRNEIAGSRRMLQQRFRQPVNFFCYPAGRYDDAAERAAKQAGYLGATTTDEGLARKSEMFTLKRVRVAGSDGVQGLRQKLSQAGA